MGRKGKRAEGLIDDRKFVEVRESWFELDRYCPIVRLWCKV